jgi:hypothetical protein
MVSVILFAVTPVRANLFVSSFGTNQVLEYNGTTGAFITDFVPAGSGGLSEPTFLTFGPQISVPDPATLFLIGLGVLSTGLARLHRKVRVHRPCALAPRYQRGMRIA